MAGRTGLSAQFGFGEESAFATRVAPSRFLEIRDESIQATIERITTQGLRAGRQVESWWVPNKKGAGGQVNFEVLNKGFGLLFKHLLGAVATATPVGGTTTRDHTATVGPLDGKSLTVQVGRPDVGGVVRPFDYIGGKIGEWEISNEVDGIVMCAVTFDFVDELLNQTLAVASYPTALVPLTYVGGQLLIAGSQVDITNLSIHGSNGLKTDRYFIRSSTLKKEQIENTEPRTFDGSFSAEFADLTLYNLFAQGQEASFSALWQGPVIEGALHYELEVSAPRVRFEGETPTVSGPDVVEQPIGYKVLAPTDGSSPISIRYRTDDTLP